MEKMFYEKSTHGNLTIVEASPDELYLHKKESGTYVNTAFITDFKDTQDWERRSILIEIPDGVEKIKIVLMAGWVGDKSKGNAVTWFDDIHLMGPIQTTPVK